MTRKQIDTTQPVEFTVTTPELGKFTVTGDYESVAPVYDRMQAVTAQEAPQRVLAAKVGNVATHLVERAKTGAEVALFDYWNNTHFRQELKQRRLYAKKVAYAKRLGLL